MKVQVNGREAYVYTGGRPFDASLPSVAFVHGALHDHSAWTLLYGSSIQGFDPRTARDARCILVWGANPYFVSGPYQLFGNVGVGGQSYVGYDFALVAVAVVCGAGVWWGLNRTRTGLAINQAARAGAGNAA